MKTMKKRGFTLVELLVVIAILAILATVSVVGYTSFIERANVSNDQTLASQLNSMITYTKADSNGKYYNVEITPDNAREIINHVLVEGGLEGKLEPQSAQHGYHYFFDLKEEEIVVLKDAVDETALSMHILRGLGVVAYDYSVSDNPATCFTKTDPSFTKYGGVRYVFLDTAGSELAELVNLFYNINSAEDFARLNELAGMELLDGKKITAFTTLINKSIFVGSSGSFMTAEGEKTLFFGTTMSSDKYLGGSKVDAFTVPSTLPMYVPSTINFFTTNSLNFDSTTYDSSAATHTTVLHLNLTLDELAKRVDPGFTNVVFTLADGKQYACVDSQIVCLEEGGATVTITPKNPISNFDFEILDNGSEYIYNNVVTDGNNVAYISWDSFATGTTFKLNATKLVGAHDDLYDAVSSGKFVWSVHDDSASYLALVNANGEFKFTGTIPAITDGTCVVKVVAKDEIGGAEKTFEIRVVRISDDQTITMDGKTVNASSVNTLVYNSTTRTYDVSATANFTYADVITNGNIKGGATFKVVPASANLTYANNKITVVPTEGTTNETLDFYYGNYKFISKDLVLYDSAHLPYSAVSNYADFVVAHSSDLKPSDFFVKTQSDWTPLGTIKLVVSTQASNADITAEIATGTLLRTDYVSSNKVSGMDTTFKFLQDYTGEVTLYLVHEYQGKETRVSTDFKVKIVSGTNVRTWNDIKNGISANTVLLSNVVFDTDAQLSVTGGTFYGNNYVLDVRNAKKDAAEHIISLSNATLDGLNIVGKVYSTFTYQDHYSSGKLDSTSIVVSNNGTIKNCYIANGRSPVRVIGDTRVEDSVIFGGKFCNIDVAKGVLTLAGDVTTINQVYEGTVGAGIVCDLTRDTNYVTMTDDCNLVQYNFIPKSAGSALPTVQITITLDLWITTVSGSIAVKMGTMVTSLIDDVNNTYDNWVYETKDANQNVTESYLNAGIVYLAATGDGASLVSKDNKSSGKVPNGYEMATYTETYHPGDDRLGLETKAHAYVYSPAKTNSANIDFENTWFKNATDAEHMEQYLPTNYVTGAMK